MFGVAMAIAVLIDATIVRGVLLPAGLALLGDRAWTRRGTKPPYVLTGKPRLTPPWLGSSQRDVTTLPRV
jgi:putative drug exporter of the RND superfamily